MSSRGVGLSALREIGGVALANLSLMALRRGHVRAVGHLISGLFVFVLLGCALDKGGLIATEIAWHPSLPLPSCEC